MEPPSAQALREMRTVSAASWKVSAPDVDLRTDSERPRGPCHRRPQRHLERPRHCSTPTPRRRQCRIERLGLAVGSGEHGGRVYPRPDRRSCRPMLASGVAWGGTLSALRPHHLSITLIARCIAKYRSPDTFPCFGAGVYTVHTHSSLPSALLSSNRTPRCSMMHPASAPRAIHEF